MIVSSFSECYQHPLACSVQLYFMCTGKQGVRAWTPQKQREKNDCPVGREILGRMLIRAAKGSVLAENTWEATIKLENIETTWLWRECPVHSVHHGSLGTQAAALVWEECTPVGYLGTQCATATTNEDEIDPFHCLQRWRKQRKRDLLGLPSIWSSNSTL